MAVAILESLREKGTYTRQRTGASYDLPALSV